MKAFLSCASFSSKSLLASIKGLRASYFRSCVVFPSSHCSHNHFVSSKIVLEKKFVELVLFLFFIRFFQQVFNIDLKFHSILFSFTSLFFSANRYSNNHRVSLRKIIFKKLLECSFFPSFRSSNILACITCFNAPVFAFIFV